MASSTEDSALNVIDIGCGEDKVDGAVGIDIVETSATDLIRDVEKEGLPYPDNSVEKIHANMAIEHMDAPTVIKECYRVLEPSGVLHIKLPHPFTTGFWQDWTHVIQPGFTREGIHYLDSEHHMHYEHDLGDWIVEEVNVAFWLNLESLPGRVISAAASKLASFGSDKTREELLKLPFTGGWLEAELSKPNRHE